MDAGSELLAAYMEFTIKKLGNRWGPDGFDPRVQACMALDKLVGDLTDNADPQRRRDLFAAHRAVKEAVIRSGSRDR